MAITAVFFHHYYSGHFVSMAGLNATASAWPGWLKPWTQHAFYGLDQAYRLLTVFFVISGFLVHSSYLRYAQRCPGHKLLEFSRYFIWRRFWRLVPVFLVALLFSFFLVYDAPFSARALRHLAVNATLLKTLVPGYFFTVNHAHWYVAVEWQINLCYPFFLLCVSRLRFGTALAIAWVLAWVTVAILPRFTNATFLVNFPSHWWLEWTFGVLIAEAHARDRRLFGRPAWFATALTLALGASIKYDWALASWILPTIFCGIIVEWAALSTRPLARLENLFAPVGICGYSLYLFHMPIIDLSLRQFAVWKIDLDYPPTWLATALFVFALNVALAWFVFKKIEQPASRLGSRLWERYLDPARPSAGS